MTFFSLSLSVIWTCYGAL